MRKMKRSKEKFDAHVTKRGTPATVSKAVRTLTPALASRSAYELWSHIALTGSLTHVLVTLQRDKTAYTVGPMLLGFFLFVVVGSGPHGSALHLLKRLAWGWLKFVIVYFGSGAVFGCAYIFVCVCVRVCVCVPVCTYARVQHYCKLSGRHQWGRRCKSSTCDTVTAAGPCLNAAISLCSRYNNHFHISTF